jgi:hypothetical protein
MFPYLLNWPFPFSPLPNHRLNFPRSLILILLLISGLHPNPGPPLTSEPFHFVQLNVNGIQNSRAELLDFLSERDIKVACLQETKLSPRSKPPSFPGYAVVRKDRPVGGGGGLMILIHNSVPFTDVDTATLTNSDPSLELQAVRVEIGAMKIDVYNIYVPPISSCPAGHWPNFHALLNFPDNDALFLGDFNAHHPSWFSPWDPSDPRGDLLASELDSSELCILNSNLSTRLPFGNTPSSSPDISLAPAHLLPSLTWAVHTRLNSDHLPITISLSTDNRTPRAHRSFTNFRLANWPGFIKEVEEEVRKLPAPTSCARDERKLRDVIVNASKHNIPSGYRKNFIPGLPNSAKTLINQRDALRAADSSDPAIPALNQQIDEAIRVSSRQRWVDRVESSDHRVDSSKCWQLLKNLSGKSSRPPPNQPISFRGKTLTKAPGIASSFCKLFTSTVRHKSDRKTRKIMRSLRAKHKLDTNFRPFTPLATRDAINASKNSSATGPDGLTAIHLKHIGPRAIAYLTELFNLSVCSADLPSIWKAAIVVPVLKPGKPANEGGSYRPISLLSPAVKVLERLLLPLISAALPKDKTQHGFAPMHSCTTALLPIVTRVAIGFNDPKPARRTAICAVDVSKAFDSVNHNLLLQQISGTDLHPNLVRWLAAYLRGRSARCVWNSATSSPRTIYIGVPQGSVLSPVLFNFFMSDCPSAADIHVAYADDINECESDSDLESLSRKLQASVDSVVEWAESKELSIAPGKSQVMLFSP